VTLDFYQTLFEFASLKLKGWGTWAIDMLWRRGAVETNGG